MSDLPSVGGPISGGPEDRGDAPDTFATAAIASAVGGGIGFFAVVSTFEPSDFDRFRRQLIVIAATVTGLLAGAALTRALTVARRPGEGALLMLLVFGTTYLCVPETDQYRVSALWPVLLLVAELVARRQMPIAVYGVVAAVIGWASMFGALTRDTAVIGALFAWWAVVLVALVSLLVPLRNWRSAWGVGVVAAVTVVLVARTAGIADGERVAVLIVAIALPLSFLSALLVGRILSPET